MEGRRINVTNRIFTVGRSDPLASSQVIRRISSVTQNQMTPLTIMKSDFMNVYNNKALRELYPYDNEEHGKNSMRRIMKSVLLIAQCFALCPVEGITSSHVEDLRFRWRNGRVLYSIVMMCGMLLFVLFTIAYYLKGNFNFETSGAFVFYLFALLCGIVFLRLAERWPQLEKLWYQTEVLQMKYGCSKNLHQNIIIVTTGILVISLVEHMLAKYTVYMDAAKCSNGGGETIMRYYVKDFNNVFLFLKFSPLLALLCEIINIYATFYWNFMDLFVAVISIILSNRFRLLNKHLTLESGKAKSEDFWREARKDYNSLSVLTKALDSCISSLVLLSFATNMFFVCQQLYNTLKKSIGTVKMVYSFLSLGYLLFRTIAVSLCAASIYDESRVTKDVLYSVPTRSYKLEVHRFLVQISTDTVALTGLKFFTVTRTLLLTLGGTVVTYVVVMVQFGNTSDSEETNSTLYCHNISVMYY